MNLKHSHAFDIVKKSLLQWLAPFGPWDAHPMFMHAVSDAEARRLDAQIQKNLGS